MVMTKHASIKYFWAKLHEFDEEEDRDEILDFIEKADKRVWQSEDPNDIPGSYLTDYLCKLEPGPNVRDLLDKIIEECGASVVTICCYRNVINHDEFSYDMLASLLNSGCNPLFDGINGRLLLDACVKALEDNDVEEECWNDIFEGFVLKLGNVKEGVSHDVGGPFAKWLQLEENQEWLKDREPTKEEEKDVSSPSSVDAAEIEKDVQGKHKLAADGGNHVSSPKKRTRTSS